MSQNHSLISEDDELISESMFTDDEILENQASLDEATEQSDEAEDTSQNLDASESLVSMDEFTNMNVDNENETPLDEPVSNETQEAEESPNKNSRWYAMQCFFFA